MARALSLLKSESLVWTHASRVGPSRKKWGECCEMPLAKQRAMGNIFITVWIVLVYTVCRLCIECLWLTPHPGYLINLWVHGM